MRISGVQRRGSNAVFLCKVGRRGKWSCEGWLLAIMRYPATEDLGHFSETKLNPVAHHAQSSRRLTTVMQPRLNGSYAATAWVGRTCSRDRRGLPRKTLDRKPPRLCPAAGPSRLVERP